MDNLGLCCMTSSGVERFQTMTRTRFLSLPRKEAEKTLRDRIINNIIELGRLVDYCASVKISHLRISSSLLPLCGEPQTGVTIEGLGIKTTVENLLGQVGNKIKTHAMTVSMHPSQYTTLHSLRPEVIENSIKDLEQHAYVLDCLGQPQSHAAPINIHPTGAGHNFTGFNAALGKCSTSVRSRLALENCDKGFWTAKRLWEFYEMYNRPNFALTFDNLHHQCNKSCGKSEETYIALYKTTWNDYPPVFHWSEGGAKGKVRAHLDYFGEIPSFVMDNPKITWECEVKAKELAIFAARKMMAAKKMLDKQEKI